MSRIAQSINQRLTLLGVPGIAGLGILVACVAFYNAAIQPMQQQLTERKQLLNERSAVARHMPKMDWRSLPSHLPPQAQADELVANVYYLAQVAKITLREAEFKEEKSDKSSLVARHLNFSVNGDYYQVRQFLSSALDEIPALALDSISFQKSRDVEAMLDVKISMTLYLVNPEKSVTPR